MLTDLFSIVAPVLICAAIGYLWVRLGAAFDPAFVTNLVMTVSAPCLVFHTLANLTVPLDALARIGAATVAVLLACGAAGAILLKAAGWSQRAFLPTLVFPNSGNMGLPLSYLAFGDVGLGFAIAIFAVYMLAQFTIGIAVASGQFAPRRLWRLPLLWALPPAILFLVLGQPPPRWLDATTQLIGGIAVPLMLIMLGVSLARLRVRSLGRSGVLAIARLLLGLAAGVAAARLLGLEDAARGVLVLQSAMPAAVFNYLFAERYRTEPEDVAGVIVLSTLLSFATLPLLLWWLL